MGRLFAKLAFYPSVALNLSRCCVSRNWDWWNEVDSLLLIGAAPFNPHVSRLHALGVRAVINLCDEYTGPVAAYAKHGIIQLRLPTVDFAPPKIDAISTSIQFIEEQHRQGHAVYVHCKVGRVRSATIAMCWLMQAYKVCPADALQRLKERRRQVSSRLGSYPVVTEFWSLLNGG